MLFSYILFLFSSPCFLYLFLFIFLVLVAFICCNLAVFSRIFPLDFAKIIASFDLWPIHSMLNYLFMHFIEAYNTFSTWKDDFPDIPVMALPATLGDEMKRLSKTYFRSPVLIKGRVDRSNIKFAIGKYNWRRKKKRKG